MEKITELKASSTTKCIGLFLGLCILGSAFLLLAAFPQLDYQHTSLLVILLCPVIIVLLISGSLKVLFVSLIATLQINPTAKTIKLKTPTGWLVIPQESIEKCVLVSRPTVESLGKTLYSLEITTSIRKYAYPLPPMKWSAEAWVKFFQAHLNLHLYQRHLSRFPTLK